MLIEVSNGEIIDKWTILKIKKIQINSPTKLLNVKKELTALAPQVSELLQDSIVAVLADRLYDVNCLLWATEDVLRECERTGEFDSEFVEEARKVYKYNDHRAEIKKEINIQTGSSLVEEKSYAKY